MNHDTTNESEDDTTSERNVTFEIPVITTSSPSSANGSNSIKSPINVTVLEHSPVRPLHSDDEGDTSFSTTINNNTLNNHVSALRSLSPGNLNASKNSRGVMKLCYLFGPVLFITIRFSSIRFFSSSECPSMVSIVDQRIKTSPKTYN